MAFSNCPPLYLLKCSPWARVFFQAPMMRPGFCLFGLQRKPKPPAAAQCWSGGTWLYMDCREWWNSLDRSAQEGSALISQRGSLLWSPDSHAHLLGNLTHGLNACQRAKRRGAALASPNSGRMAPVLSLISSSLLSWGESHVLTHSSSALMRKHFGVPQPSTPAVMSIS